MGNNILEEVLDSDDEFVPVHSAYNEKETNDSDPDLPPTEPIANNSKQTSFDEEKTNRMRSASATLPLSGYDLFDEDVDTNQQKKKEQMKIQDVDSYASSIIPTPPNLVM